jgi:choline dehydrogenase-like flavoprotein
MSDDPSHGVVDADCRVHGLHNLYVAGGSVFPTSGSASPTLTIVELALRLADHLASGRVAPVASIGSDDHAPAAGAVAGRTGHAGQTETRANASPGETKRERGPRGAQ